MKITDKTSAPTFPTVQLNDVPVGQIFRGTIQAKIAGPITGLFFKAHGQNAVRGVTNGQVAQKGGDVVVVKLDEPRNLHGFANILLNCYPVTDYEPLDVEMILTKAGSGK